MSGLQRFTDAQKMDFDTAMAEIRNGRKESHWMWYIFPQLGGLGFSSMSEYYGIRSAKRCWNLRPMIPIRCSEARMT